MAVWIALFAAFMGVGVTIFACIVAANVKKRGGN